MKSFIKKSSFALFMMMLLSVSVIFASAAEDTGYEIDIYAESLSVASDEYIQLQAEVEGVDLQPVIVWSSSDESIATVNSYGTVKGQAEGTAEITATTTVNGETVTTTYPVRVEHEGKIFNTLLSQTHVASYRFSTEYGGFYYNDDKVAWQTLFGFSKFYDYMAPISAMEYDHLRMFYTYDNQDFLMEFWKGHYGAFIGCEIGLYHRDAQGLKKGPFDFYNTANEKYWPVMDMAFYRQQNEGDANEDYVLEFKRPVDRYWWCTGFIPGELRELVPADELRVEATLTFIDKEMADCTAKAMEEAGFKPSFTAVNLPVDSYYQNGESITFKWQGLTESQEIPGFLGKELSDLVAAIGAIVDVLVGILVNNLLSI